MTDPHHDYMHHLYRARCYALDRADTLRARAEIAVDVATREHFEREANRWFKAADVLFDLEQEG